MNKEEFKKIAKEIFTSSGLSKKGNYFYSISNDLICVVGLQKSNYSEAFYINIGFVLKELRPELVDPKDADGDVRSRFDIEWDDNLNRGLYDLEKLSESNLGMLRRNLESNLEKFIIPIKSINDLKELIGREPHLLYQTSFKAKQLLGYE